MFVKNLMRYWHTLRYLKGRQILGRIIFRCYRPRPDRRPAPNLRRLTGRWVEPASRTQSLFADNRFHFLNQVGSLDEIGWDNVAYSKLWRYNLHYFDDLNAQGAAARTDWHRKLLLRWEEENPPAQGSGWEPYPTSLRMVNWIKWAWAGNPLPSVCLQSLAVQARWLTRRLEYHLLGNHLFANAKALVFAGCFFSGPEADAWLKKGLAILAKEVNEQILFDGGQFERSPMYHALAVEDLLDLINLLTLLKTSQVTQMAQVAAPVPAPALMHVSFDSLLSYWSRTLKTMLYWLRVMNHPDGEISFFNDAAWGIAPCSQELEHYAERLQIPFCKTSDQLVYLPTSGYFRLENQVACVLFDVAPIGPDYLPGHAHADTLSIECSLFGQRLLVNSGTSEYGLGTERQRQRGTYAHNTVTVNGENSSEVWSGFRVARRARPRHILKEVFPSGFLVSAAHDGYQRLARPIQVRRTVSLFEKSLFIEDRLDGAYTTAIASFHLHPLVTVRHLGADRLRLVVPNGRSAVLTFTDPDTVTVEASTWHPEFGVSLPNQCIRVGIRQGLLVSQLEWE